MMAPSGAPNRSLLVAVGILLLALGAVTLLTSSGLLATWSFELNPGDHLLPSTAPPTWIPAAILAASIILALLGLSWIVSAIPQYKRIVDFRLHHDARTGMTRLSNSSLQRAIEDSAVEISGVLAARARLGGTADHPELLLAVEVEERADIQGCMDQLNGRVCAEVEQTLEVTLTSVRLIMDPVHQSKRAHEVVIPFS